MSNNGIVPSHQPKGEVTIKVRDAHTLEIKREVKKTNVVTLLTYSFMARGLDMRGYHNEGFANGFEIRLTDSYRIPVNVNAGMHYSGIIGASSTLQGWTFYSGENPKYFQMEQRYNTPSSTRTINTIFLSGGTNLNSHLIAAAFVSLNSPCIQETNEILDVTYRLVLSDLPENTHPNSAGISSTYGQDLLTRALRGYGNFPDYAYPYWKANLSTKLHDTPTGAYEYRIGGRSNVGTMSNYHHNRHKIDFSFTLGSNQNGNSSFGGKIFSTLLYGANPETNNNLWPRGFVSGYHNQYWLKVDASDVPNYPIQPIHSHDATSTTPFLDVDHLSTGTGSLVVDGSAWTQNDFAKMYRIEYVTTGDVGTSEYFFRKANTSGYQSDRTYDPSWHPTYHRWRYVGYKTVENGYGLNDTNSYEEHDGFSLIMWDTVELDEKGGITIQKQATGEFVNFDATTTPAMDAIEVRQCASVGGSVYVASIGGLFKIDNEFTSPTVTQFTTSVHGIPTSLVDATPCYGVAEGYNGRVWAAFDGGLSYTEDGGTTWVNLNETTTPSIVIPGVTDGSWDQIRYLTVDREHPDHQLAIVSAADNNSDQFDWYTPAGGGVATKSTRYPMKIYGGLRCSYRKGMWVQTEITGSNGKYGGRFMLMAFGNPAGVSTFYSSSDYVNPCRPTFMYDYYDNPMFIGPRAPQGYFQNTYGPTTVYSQYVDDIHRSEYYEYAGDAERISSGFAPFERHKYPVIWEQIARKSTDITPITNTPHITLECVGITPWGNPQGGSGTNTSNAQPYSYKMARGLEYSQFEEVTWEQYGFDGTNWVKWYNQPAIDSSSYNVPGVRHRFDINDHFFNGRSMIDVTDSFSAGQASTQFTVVATVTGSPKLSPSTSSNAAKQQDPRSIIFSMSDPTVNKKVSLWWTGITNEMELVEYDATGAATSTIISPMVPNGETHRLAYSFNETSFEVFQDGVSIFTYTMSSAMDLSNAAGRLKVHIGADTHHFGLNTEYVYPDRFFRGTMQNIQLWNVAWNSTNAADDMLDITGVTSTIPAVSLIAHFNLTETISEAKPTHQNPEVLDDTITIGFNNGTGSPAFVSTDYNTFGVADGIMKDNAITFSHNSSTYVHPADIEYSTITNDVGTNTVPSSTYDVEEYAVLGSINSTGDTSPRQLIGNGKVGSIYYRGSSYQDQMTDIGGTALQPITGDGYVEFSIAGDEMYGVVGLVTSHSTSYSVSSVSYGIFFDRGNNIHIREGGTTTQATVGTYLPGDRFRIERIGSTVSYYKYVNDVLMQLGVSSATASSGTVYGKVALATLPACVYDVIVKYTRPAYCMRFGDESSQTGAYNPDYIVLDAVGEGAKKTVQINIDGVPATIVWGNDISFDTMPLPGPGQVVINAASGHLFFHSDDAGKTITGKANIIKEK